MTELGGIDEYVESIMPAYIAELKELIRIPSISQRPVHIGDLHRVVVAAGRIAQTYGFSATVIEGFLHPPGLVAEIEVD